MKNKTREIEFPVEKLLKCDEFKKFHPAFIRALLPNALYTKKKAQGIVEKYFKGGKK